MTGRLKIGTAFAALSLVLACAAPAAPSPARGQELAGASVIGGTDAVPGEFPYAAYIEELGRGISCSGSVVAPDVVLTAAHCVTDLHTGAKYRPNGFRVVTGDVNWTSPERQVSRVIKVLSYPHFSFFGRDRGFGDAALLKLATPTSAPPVRLATGSLAKLLIHAGARVTVAGWGLTRPGNREISKGLVWSTLVVEGTSCEGLPGRLCAIDYPKATTGICGGDSGGPLSAHDKGGPIQIGISEAGYTNCSTRRPSVFTRTDSVGAWLHSRLARLR